VIDDLSLSEGWTALVVDLGGSFGAYQPVGRGLLIDDLSLSFIAFQLVLGRLHP